MQVTKVRHIYNRALQNLPHTQHQLIWNQYLKWACSLTKTDKKFAPLANLAYKRYVKLKPDKHLDYLDFLLQNDLLEEALSLYLNIIE